MPPKATSTNGAEEKEATTASQPSPLPSTLRHRHEKRTDAANTKSGAASSTSTAAPVATTSAEKALPHPSHMPYSTLKTLGLGVAFVLLSFALLLALFVGLQVVAVDDMDLRRTAARLEVAGRGEEWFPVWLGNFVVNSLTQVHVEVAGDLRSGAEIGAGDVTGGHTLSSGGSSSKSRKSGGPPPPPPPRVSMMKPPPSTKRPDAAADSASTGSAANVTTPISSPATTTTKSAAAVPGTLRCYTLEAYSETFLRAPRRDRTEHFFSCGTRVHDLRTEANADVLAACEAHTTFPKTPGGATANAEANSVHRFPTLRVVLTPAEEKRHRDIQPVNTVTQRIPLLRLNDDYCDCLDGTDELLTNACSMSGPLTPAAGSRWKSYLVSQQAVRLYDDPDELEQTDMEARGETGTLRKRGDVGDRLFTSQGPVLPFLCTCGGTVRQLLAPSLVGDGVVDCCAAEDEAALPHSPFAAAPLFSHNAPAVEAMQRRHLAAEKARVLQDWRRRQAAVAAQVDGKVSYADPLFPYHTNARALLVDRGYYTLFTAEAVRQAKVAVATALRDLYARGHSTQRLRVQKGWERLGQGLTENRTQLQMEVANLTQQLTDLENFVRGRMEERRTHNPIEAGISMELLQQHDRMAHTIQAMQMELQHLVMTNLHHAYGDHYEYYPLVRRALSLLSEKVTDSTTPADLYSGIAQDRARRYVTPAQLEELTRAAQQNQGAGAAAPHIDNISVSYYGIELMRHTMAAQRFDSADAPYVAQQLGLLPRGGAGRDAPFDPHVFDKISDPFLKSPVLPIGAWQPYHAERNGGSMQLADPAGDVHLPRRACVAPASALFRGGGRLQFPTRHPDPPRTVTLADEEHEKKSLKDKLKAAADGAASAAKRISIPHHFHLPSVFAVDRYMGPVRCEADPLTAESSHRRNAADDTQPHRQVQSYATFLCDTKDRVLYWGRNGKCTQEVVIGTPSACTAWALKAAREALKELTPRAAGEKPVGNATVKTRDGPETR